MLNTRKRTLKSKTRNKKNHTKEGIVTDKHQAQAHKQSLLSRRELKTISTDYTMPHCWPRLLNNAFPWSETKFSEVLRRQWTSFFYGETVYGNIWMTSLNASARRAPPWTPHAAQALLQFPPCYRSPQVPKQIAAESHFKLCTHEKDSCNHVAPALAIIIQSK